MTKEPFITIGIPVYNGGQCIKFTLESIFVALKNINDSESVEILVFDNKSTDDTKDIVMEFIDNGFNLRYSCNEKNVGYDGNIDNIVRSANGRYIWFLGCGEVVKSDSLARILEKIDINIEYTNIILDFDIFSELKGEIIDSRVLAFEEDVLIEGKNNFQFGKYAPAVSSNIINRRKWLDVIERPLIVVGWCHIERILNMISLDNNSKTLLLTYPYFTLYREIGGWWESPKSYQLLLLHIKVINSMISMGYRKEIVKKLKNKMSRFALVLAITQSKEYGLKADVEIFKELYTVLKYDYFLWVIIYPLLLFPNKFLFLPKIAIETLKFFKKVAGNVKNNIF
ncbi:glycosyltransferase family 2 protein [Marinomonas sp.]|uniref:glycosyltransferase family 2 protein n=1 Tax=Marinomonas sp. TaxID=1904862 RepID=UPI003A8D0B2C